MRFLVLLCLLHCEETALPAVDVATVDIAASVLNTIEPLCGVIDPASNALDDIHKKFEVDIIRQSVPECLLAYENLEKLKCYPDDGASCSGNFSTHWCAHSTRLGWLVNCNFIADPHWRVIRTQDPNCVARANSIHDLELCRVGCQSDPR